MPKIFSGKVFEGQHIWSTQEECRRNINEETIKINVEHSIFVSNLLEFFVCLLSLGDFKDFHAPKMEELSCDKPIITLRDRESSRFDFFSRKTLLLSLPSVLRSI